MANIPEMPLNLTHWIGKNPEVGQYTVGKIWEAGIFEHCWE